MLQGLSLIVGLYVVTRMIELDANPQTTKFTSIFARITVFVTVICLLGIILDGSPTV